MQQHKAASSPGQAEGRDIILIFLILLFFQCPCTQGLLRTWKSASQPDCSLKVILVQGRSLGPGVRVQLMAAETLGTHLAFGKLLAHIQHRLLAQGTRQKSRWT